MVRLREQDFRAALDALGAMSEAARDVASFAAAGVERLPALVASEFTTLSVCNLVNGRRQVYGMPAGALSADDRAAFDRHFHNHPLVRFHGHEGGRRTQRISDCLPFERFRRSALYNDYYRRIRIDNAMALPVYVGNGLLVSFVFNRTRRDFSERERLLLDLVGTRREAEILRWLAAGKSDAQIGAILGTSPRTVQKHLQHLYEKLGVENRTAAAARLLSG